MTKLRILAALLFALLGCSYARAQDYVQSYTFVIPTIGGPGTATSFANTGVNSFAIFWSPATTVSSCSVQVDSSADGVTWGSGDLINSQNCAVVGSTSAATLPAGSIYIRVHLTALTGNGGVNVTLKGWGGAGNSTGGGVGPGTPTQVGCFNTSTNLMNCAVPITVTSSLINIPANMTVGAGGGAASVSYPSGATSGCQTPAAGFNILCSDGTLNTLDASLNGSAYLPLGFITSGVGAPVGSCVAPQIYTNTSTNNIYSCIAGSWVISSGTPNGAAGGDLASTYPNPTVAGINGTAFSGVNGDFVAFGAGNTPVDSGLLVSSLAPAPATQAAVTGENLCAYNQGTGAWTLCKLAPFSPITPVGDTLTNASLTTEQFFATSYTIPAGTITAQKEFTFNMGSDYTGTGTPSTGTLRIRLCTTGLPTPAGCVVVFQSSAVAPGVNTRASWVPLHLIGTAAAGASANVIALAGNGQSITIWGSDLKGASTVVLNTSVQLFLVYSIQYANTTASSSLTLTALWATAGPLI